MIKRKVFRLLDKFGWAFYFIAKEQQKYSKHEVTYLDWEGMQNKFDNINCDVFYIPTPVMCGNEIVKLINKIKKTAKFQNTKIIGAYSGLINTRYNYADLVLPISISDYDELKNTSRFPVTFLPESIDTEKFNYIYNPIIPDKFGNIELQVGWVGKNAADKRAHILDKLIVPIKKLANHGAKFFKDGRDPQETIDFLHSLDCLILCSSHECMPRVVLEAMSCGLPVIATNVGSLPWMIDKEFVVPAQPEDTCIKEINKRLRWFIENPDLKLEVGKRNREWVEKNLSWNVNQPIWDETFDALCDNNFQKIENISKNYIKQLETNIKNRSLITIPDLNNRTKLNIYKVIDEHGWAYDFIYKEQILYSQHKITRGTIGYFTRFPHVEKSDIVYFHASNMGESTEIIENIANQNVKIIGAYGGETIYSYPEKETDLIVSISYPFTEQLKLKYPEKTVIFMPEGIDTNYFKVIPFCEDRFNVGWAGRKSPVKRIHLLDLLKYPIIKQSNDSSETMLPSRTLDEMLEFYKNIDILVLTSSSECMPRVVLEAMSCGLPIVATRVGSLPMVLEDMWMIDSTNESEIVRQMNDKLDLLKNNPKLRQQVGERNRKYIEKYLSWKVLMPLWDDMFLALYQDRYDLIEKISQTFITHIFTKREEDYLNYENIEIKPEIIESLIVIPEEPPKMIEFRIPTKKELIERLLNNNIDFWLLENSCLECMKFGVLKSEKITIGVKNGIVANRIRESIENADDLFNIKQPSNIKTKIYNLYNLEIQVPIPVVKYLEDYYHKPWQSLMEK